MWMRIFKKMYEYACTDSDSSSRSARFHQAPCFEIGFRPPHCIVYILAESAFDVGEASIPNIHHACPACVSTTIVQLVTGHLIVDAGTP